MNSNEFSQHNVCIHTQYMLCTNSWVACLFAYLHICIFANNLFTKTKLWNVALFMLLSYLVDLLRLIQWLDIGCEIWDYHSGAAENLVFWHMMLWRHHLHTLPWKKEAIRSFGTLETTRPRDSNTCQKTWIIIETSFGGLSRKMT